MHRIELTEQQWDLLQEIMNDAFLSYDLASERENAHPRIAEMRENTRELFNQIEKQIRTDN